MVSGKASGKGLFEAMLAATEAGELGPYYRMLEEMDERSQLFATLRLAGMSDPDTLVEHIISNMEWARLLPDEARARCVDELRELMNRAAAMADPTIQEQQKLAMETEDWVGRWRLAAEQANPGEDLKPAPVRRPGSAWRLRIDRPPLLHNAIVDDSEYHLATVFSKLVVDDWFDLEQTNDDLWRIRVGNVSMLVSVDGAGQAARVLVDTPHQPPPRTGKSSAFHLCYVRLDDERLAHIQVLDPHPDLVAVLPTAALWQAGSPWSILCGRGQDAVIEQISDPERTCRACKRELARITELVEAARWNVARRLASAEIESAVRARLHEVPF
jgi:hypothetical protein